MPCLTAETPANASAHRWLMASDLPLGSLPSAVACARGHVAAMCWEWRLASLRDDATLIVSELATNAVRASSALDGRPPVWLRLLSDRADLLIEVWDMSPYAPVIASPDSDALSGRGLLLVAGIARQWGWHRAGNCKCVWAMLAT